MTERRIERIAAAVALVFVLALGWTTSASAGETVTWFSEPKSPAQLSEELKALYQTLHAARMLPRQSYVDREGLPVEKILYQERQYFGPAFAKEVEAILCGWNRRVCQAGTDAQGRPAFTWTNRRGDELVIPRLEFTIYTAPQLYEKRRGESLEAVVVDRARGCLELTEDCRRRIQNLNRRKEDVLSPTYEGHLVVPALALRLVLPGRPEPTESGTIPKVPSELRAIRQNVVLPTRQLKLESAGHDRFKESSGRVHERIGMPRTLLPPAARTLALFDELVDTTHCYLLSARISIPVRPPEPPEDRDCGGEDSQPRPSAHGTHMAGLMVAQRDGSAFGINPRVRIVAYPIKTSNPAFIEDLAAMMRDAVEAEGAEIGNLSLRVPTPDGGNPAFNRLKTPADLLWVVAAGNDQAQTARDGCFWFPACAGLKLPNVMSVVAVNLDDVPELFSGSNSGEDFDLAAPGQGVVSTIPGGRLGPMSGTSQATAIVSAISSVLIGRDRTLAPRDVRSRLIYTTDIYATLEGRALGGRVNLARALELERDVVILKNGGTIEGILRRSVGVLKYTKRPGGGWDDVSLRHLRRIATDERAQRVLFRDRGGLRPERVGLATIDAGARWIIDTPNGPQTVVVDEVRDFTSCHLVMLPAGDTECWRN